MHISKFAISFMLLMLLAMSLLQSAAAQDNPHTVSGMVTDQSDGNTLPGVNILVKGTPRGTSTDTNGEYRISVSSPNDTLVFTFIGYGRQEVPINGRTRIDIALTPQTIFGEDIVVTGYSTQRRVDLTGSVAVVNIDEVKKESNANVLQNLQGRIPGVEITTDGAPGTNATFTVRGFGSIQDNSPLFVIDGVPTQSISGLNPKDIESIQVLKDASSAAIYGSRASNGVVLITTKKGKGDEVQVAFETYQGVSWRRDHLDMLDAREFGQVLWQAKRNDGLPLEDAVYGSGPEPTIPEFIDDNQRIPAANTNWQEEVYRPSQDQFYNLGVSKRVEKSNFYVGLNYTKEDGLIEHTDFERYSARLNTSFNVLDRVDIGENLSVSRESRVVAPGGAILSSLYQYSIIPVRDLDGNWGGPVKNLGDRLNPLGILSRNKDNVNKDWRIFGDVFVNVEILETLNFKATAGIDFADHTLKNFEPTFVEGRFVNNENELTEISSNNFNTIINGVLSYAWSNDIHNFDVLAGAERVHDTFETFSASKRDFFLENEDFRFLDGGSEINNITGSGTESVLISQFGKVDYAFKNKYLISGTIRRDASSRFSKDNRFAVFPAFSLGWRLHEEDFFPESEFITDLKIRGSWGQNGNQKIGDFTFASFFGLNPDFSNYDLIGSNTGSQTGFITTQIGNPNIVWEKGQQTNIGIDAGFFDNRLRLTADYFVKNTKDLLVNPQLLSVRGEGAPPFINAGEIQNKGLELLVRYSNDKSKLNYNVDFTFTSFKNEVISIGEDGNDEIIRASMGKDFRISPGHPVGAPFGHVADGIFKTQEEVDAHADQPGKGLGQIRYKDLNGDGVVDDQDRTFIGNPYPDFSFGINFSANYKNLDLSLFIDGKVGNDIYNFQRFITHSFLFNSNHSTDLLDAWSPENPDSDIPMVSSQNPNNALRPSTWYIDDGSFTRLKSITLGYTLPRSTIKSGNVRIYVQGQNLVNITGFDGLDYEPITRGTTDVGVLEEFQYPHSKSLTVGVNFEF